MSKRSHPSVNADRVSPPETVDAYMNALVHPHKAAIQELRELVLSVDPLVREQVKWNAPSFRLEDHFATLRIHPAPMLQLVLHSGSRKKASPKQFEVPDPRGLLRWVAGDRCVVTFTSPGEVRLHESALKRIIRSWIRQL